MAAVPFTGEAEQLAPVDRLIGPSWGGERWST